MAKLPLAVRKAVFDTAPQPDCPGADQFKTNGNVVRTDHPSNAASGCSGRASAAEPGIERKAEVGALLVGGSTCWDLWHAGCSGLRRLLRWLKWSSPDDDVERNRCDASVGELPYSNTPDLIKSSLAVPLPSSEPPVCHRRLCGVTSRYGIMDDYLDLWTLTKRQQLAVAHLGRSSATSYVRSGTPGAMTNAQDGDPSGGGRRLRRDAMANQERVLTAAVSAMLREGRAVPMATIAAEAGVGVATLYRRYATREALLEALAERSFRIVLVAAEKATTRHKSASAALDWFLDYTIEHRAELIFPLQGSPSELPPSARTVQNQVHRAIAHLLERGRMEGSIRADVTTTDVVIFAAMLAQPLSGASGWDSIARRQKQLFLRSVLVP